MENLVKGGGVSSKDSRSKFLLVLICMHGTSGALLLPLSPVCLCCYMCVFNITHQRQMAT